MYYTITAHVKTRYKDLRAFIYVATKIYEAPKFRNRVGRHQTRSAKNQEWPTSIPYDVVSIRICINPILRVLGTGAAYRQTTEWAGLQHKPAHMGPRTFLPAPDL